MNLCLNNIGRAAGCITLTVNKDPKVCIFGLRQHSPIERLSKKEHPNECLVEINDLTKYFDIGQDQIVHAVDGVSLSINSKEVVGLVGESGSGKSTLGKAVLGLHDKTSGNVSFAGQVLPQKYRSKDFQSRAQQMQMIFRTLTLR